MARNTTASAVVLVVLLHLAVTGHALECSDSKYLQTGADGNDFCAASCPGHRLGTTGCCGLWKSGTGVRGRECVPCLATSRASATSDLRCSTCAEDGATCSTCNGNKNLALDAKSCDDVCAPPASGDGTFTFNECTTAPTKACASHEGMRCGVCLPHCKTCTIHSSCTTCRNDRYLLLDKVRRRKRVALSRGRAGRRLEKESVRRGLWGKCFGWVGGDGLGGGARAGGKGGGSTGQPGASAHTTPHHST